MSVAKYGFAASVGLTKSGDQQQNAENPRVLQTEGDYCPRIPMPSRLIANLSSQTAIRDCSDRDVVDQRQRCLLLRCVARERLWSAPIAAKNRKFEKNASRAVAWTCSIAPISGACAFKLLASCGFSRGALRLPASSQRPARRRRFRPCRFSRQWQSRQPRRQQCWRCFRLLGVF